MDIQKIKRVCFVNVYLVTHVFMKKPELARHLSAAKTTRPPSTAIRLLHDLWIQCGNLNDGNKRRDCGGGVISTRNRKPGPMFI